ncbi:MAG TPA: transcriptional regulator [Clostridium sp.]|uniref:ArsR/SmtB family transcription factor n=1 Tax=Clostridium sp. TaxID=1506 RepID=UPI000E8F8204|nr:transcriptional regulator [Clostridium sp.]
MDSNYMKYTEVSEILKVMAHPVRLCVIKGLLETGSCNVTHMQQCLNIPQSTLSQHLQKLKAAGIIKGMRNGVEINYKVCNELVVDLVNALFK